MVEPVAPTTESTRPSHQPPANERTSSLITPTAEGTGPRSVTMSAMPTHGEAAVREKAAVLCGRHRRAPTEQTRKSDVTTQNVSSDGGGGGAAASSAAAAAVAAPIAAAAAAEDAVASRRSSAAPPASTPPPPASTPPPPEGSRAASGLDARRRLQTGSGKAQRECVGSVEGAMRGGKALRRPRLSRLSLEREISADLEEISTPSAISRLDLRPRMQSPTRSRASARRGRRERR